MFCGQKRVFIHAKLGSCSFHDMLLSAQGSTMSQLHRKHKKLGSRFTGCLGLRALSTFEKVGSVAPKTMPKHQALFSITYHFHLRWFSWQHLFVRQLWHFCTHSSYFQLLPPAPFPKTAGLPATKNHIDGLDLVLLPWTRNANIQECLLPNSPISCAVRVRSGLECMTLLGCSLWNRHESSPSRKGTASGCATRLPKRPRRQTSRTSVNSDR